VEPDIEDAADLFDAKFQFLIDIHDALG